MALPGIKKAAQNVQSKQLEKAASAKQDYSNVRKCADNKNYSKKQKSQAIFEYSDESKKHSASDDKKERYTLENFTKMMESQNFDNETANAAFQILNENNDNEISSEEINNMVKILQEQALAKNGKINLNDLAIYSEIRTGELELGFGELGKNYKIDAETMQIYDNAKEIDRDNLNTAQQNTLDSVLKEAGEDINYTIKKSEYGTILLESENQTVCIDKDGFIMNIIEDNRRATKIEYETNKGNITPEMTKLRLDGNIDTTMQQQIGDCWLLSGINAISYTKTGNKILKEAVAPKTDGTGLIINFEGYNNRIEVSYQEIKDAINSREYSKGDNDMVMWELAFEKLSSRDGVISTHKNINGGSLDAVFYAITGKSDYGNNPIGQERKSGLIHNIASATDRTNSTSPLAPYKPERITENLAEEIKFEMSFNSTLDKIEKTGSTAATFDVSPVKGNAFFVKTRDAYGNEIQLHKKHAYAIKSVNGDNVTIINPWDSYEEITLTRKTLMTNIDSFNYIDLS